MSNDIESNSDATTITTNLIIPSLSTGLIVGKFGEQIHYLQEMYGVFMKFMNVSGLTNTLHIRGEPHAVAEVISHIQQLLEVTAMCNTYF